MKRSSKPEQLRGPSSHLQNQHNQMIQNDNMKNLGRKPYRMGTPAVSQQIFEEHEPGVDQYDDLVMTQTPIVIGDIHINENNLDFYSNQKALIPPDISLANSENKNMIDNLLMNTQDLQSQLPNQYEIVCMRPSQIEQYDDISAY